MNSDERWAVENQKNLNKIKAREQLKIEREKQKELEDQIYMIENNIHFKAKLCENKKQSNKFKTDYYRKKS